MFCCKHPSLVGSNCNLWIMLVIKAIIHMDPLWMALQQKNVFQKQTKKYQIYCTSNTYYLYHNQWSSSLGYLSWGMKDDDNSKFIILFLFMLLILFLLWSKYIFNRNTETKQTHEYVPCTLYNISLVICFLLFFLFLKKRLTLLLHFIRGMSDFIHLRKVISVWVFFHIMKISQVLFSQYENNKRWCRNYHVLHAVF